MEKKMMQILEGKLIFFLDWSVKLRGLRAKISGTYTNAS